jgi:hypothetical protein
MKKLKLSLDDLRVDSFVTSPGAEVSGGTVVGHGGHGTREDPSCAGYTCNGEGSCGNGFTCTPKYCTGGEIESGLVITGCERHTERCVETQFTWCVTALTCHETCHCGNYSVEGYASCGTTCQENTCGHAGCLPTAPGQPC